MAVCHISAQLCENRWISFFRNPANKQTYKRWWKHNFLGGAEQIPARWSHGSPRSRWWGGAVDRRNLFVTLPDLLFRRRRRRHHHHHHHHHGFVIRVSLRTYGRANKQHDRTVPSDAQEKSHAGANINEKRSEATRTLRAGCRKADPRTSKQINTHRQGRLQYTAQLSAQCNEPSETHGKLQRHVAIWQYVPPPRRLWFHRRLFVCLSAGLCKI